MLGSKCGCCWSAKGIHLFGGFFGLSSVRFQAHLCVSESVFQNFLKSSYSTTWWRGFLYHRYALEILLKVTDFFFTPLLSFKICNMHQSNVTPEGVNFSLRDESNNWNTFLMFPTTVKLQTSLTVAGRLLCVCYMYSWMHVSVQLICFSQDENMINFIKGGLKIRTSYQIYK